MVNFPHKHGAFQWVFIYFKAVLYNDIYKAYSAERNNDPTSKDCLAHEAEYPFLLTLYDHFGDVHQYWQEEDGYPLFDQMFEQWQKDNSDKLMLFLNGIGPHKVVHAGEPIVPGPFEVIYSIPKSYDINAFATQFAEILKRAYEAMNQDWIQSLPVSLYRTEMIGGEGNGGDSISGFRGKIFATERRIDAYIWKHRMDMKLKDCVKQAAISKQRCWAHFYNALAAVAETQNKQIADIDDSLADESKQVSRLAIQGKQVVDNTTLGNFPSPKKLPPT